MLILIVMNTQIINYLPLDNYICQLYIIEKIIIEKHIICHTRYQYPNNIITNSPYHNYDFPIVHNIIIIAVI